MTHAIKVAMVAKEMLQSLHLVALVDRVTQGSSPAKGEVLSSRRSSGVGWQPDRSRLCILRMWDILYDPFLGHCREQRKGAAAAAHCMNL